MALIFVVALCGVYELEVQRLLGEFRSLVHALVLPYGGVYEVLRQWGYPELLTKGKLTKFDWDE